MHEAPTEQEFIDHIRRSPSNSAGGETGLTYNMMKKWSSRTISWAHKHLVTLWKANHTPDWWKKRMLEVLRKCWTGIFNFRFRVIRERAQIMADSQHGFRHERGCVDALLQLHNCVEQVQEFSDTMLFSTWDIKRAFDSIGK